MNFLGGAFAAERNAKTVGIRPEHLKVQNDGLIKGVLRHAEKLGNETFAYVDAGALGDISARMEGSLDLQPGANISLSFSTEKLYRFDAEGLSINA
jgi:multiple sugar transport system ATP-binding protein